VSESAFSVYINAFKSVVVYIIPNAWPSILKAAIAPGLAELDAIDDAGMIQFIRDNRIIGIQQGFE